MGFRVPRDFIFREEIAALQSSNANLAVTVTMSSPGDEPWSGAVGRIDARLLAATVPGIATHRAHVCGPPAMMDAVKVALTGLGIVEANIKTEAFGTIKRNPTGRGAGSSEIAGKVFFQASDTSALVAIDDTILDAADAVGVFIDNACRSGTCGSCRAKLLSGNVSMAVQDSLTEQDKTVGYILTCQAKIRGDVIVDV